MARRAGDELGPRVGGVDVDRGELADRVLCAPQAPDEKAVRPDELAGAIGLQVALFGLSGRLVWSGVAGDQ